VGEDGVEGAEPPEEFRTEDGRRKCGREIWGEEGTDADGIEAGCVQAPARCLEIKSIVFRYFPSCISFPMHTHQAQSMPTIAPLLDGLSRLMLYSLDCHPYTS
jgi:hypothetical protein